MKKNLGGLFLLGSFAFATAQTIKFDQTVLDYGTVAPGSDGNRVFTFKNTGDKPLILSNVAPGCGCTTPEWSRDPIMPGKEGKIKVHYNTTPGQFKKPIDIFSNDPANGRVTLYIQGNVDANLKTQEVPASKAEKVKNELHKK